MGSRDVSSIDVSLLLNQYLQEHLVICSWLYQDMCCWCWNGYSWNTLENYIIKWRLEVSNDYHLQCRRVYRCLNSKFLHFSQDFKILLTNLSCHCDFDFKQIWLFHVAMFCQILKWVIDIAILKVSMVPCFICWVCGSMICEKLIHWMY